MKIKRLFHTLPVTKDLERDSAIKNKNYEAIRHVSK